MEFERKKFEVKIDGVTSVISIPTVKQSNDFSKLPKENGELENGITFLEWLGLPRHISENLEVSHFTKIFNHISEEVKKN